VVIDWSSGLTVAGVLAAVGAMVVGFAGHELMHIGTLTALGRRPRIELGFHRLIFAAVPPNGTPRWQNALALLAPIPWAFVGLWAAFSAIQPPLVSIPLSLNGLLFVVGFAVGALPSPADVFVLLMYRPMSDAAGSEVVADG